MRGWLETPNQACSQHLAGHLAAAAGLLVAGMLITGQRADASGHRKRSAAIWSALVIAVMLGMFSVKDDPSYTLARAGPARCRRRLSRVRRRLLQRDASAVSTPDTIGRVSGFGWAMGYFGGIFLLLICYVGFIAPDVGWFGVSSAGGLNIRAVAVFSAVWFAVFAIPVLLAVPESPPGPKRRRVSFFASYGLLVNDIGLFRRDRNAVYFLIASALYRDGLAIFAFGAILAVSVCGMAQSTVLIFGIAANIVAALGHSDFSGGGPDRSQEGDHDLAGRTHHHVDHPAVCPCTTMFWIFA